jgi:holo-[acyl-carrier protein] synthase
MPEVVSVMIVGLGIDFLENSRMEEELSRSRWRQEDGVFTAREIGWCDADQNPTGRYAACFAAKEAAFKALGVPASDLAISREAELAQGPCHAQPLRLHGRLKVASERLGVSAMKLSIARDARRTGAIIILES